MSLSIRLRQLTAPLSALILTACVFATSAQAQDFRSDPVDEKLRLLGARAQGLYTNNRPQFDEYFQKYYFPAMTRSTPAGLAEVGKLRVDLFKKFLWNTNNAQLQKDLTTMAFKTMGKIVVSQGNPPYHPAVRYNAILAIGQLDQQYAIESGGNARPPIPYQPATKALTTIVDRGVQAGQFPPSVILGALIGLERHAKYSASLAPGAADTMTTALLRLVNQDKPIQEMDPDSYAWLRVKAASALANLGTVGPKNAVHDSIVKLIGSLKNLDDRTAAAALLSKIKYDGAKIDGPAATAALFKLAGDISVAELKRAETFEQMRLAGGGALSGRAQQIAMQNPDGVQDAFPRRHVLARLVELRSGLSAVHKAVPEDAQKRIDVVLTAIKPVIDVTADDKATSLRVADTIRRMSGELSQFAAPAEDEPAEDEGFSAGPPPAAEAGAAAAPGNVPAPANGAPAADAPAAEAPRPPAAATPQAPAATPADSPAEEPASADAPPAAASDAAAPTP